MKLNPGLPWQKQHPTRKQISLKLKEEASVTFGAHRLMAPKLGHFGK